MTGFDHLQHARVLSAFDESRQTLTIELALVAWQSNTYSNEAIKKENSATITADLIVKLWRKIGGFEDEEHKRRSKLLENVKQVFKSSDSVAVDHLDDLIQQLTDCILPKKPSPETQTEVMNTLNPKIQKILNEHCKTS